MIQAGELRNKISFYEAAEGQNELGEDIQDGLALIASNVPAKIIPITGTNRNTSGGLDDTTITHKIWIRTEMANSISLNEKMVIVYNFQRYDIKWVQPVYVNERFMEILATLEVSI